MRVHGRSADLGPVYFADTEGRIYRDVDVKGAGNVEWSGAPGPWEDRPHHNRVEGLMNKEDALHDAQMAELFTKAGVRTHRCMAIIELTELPFPEPGSTEPTMVPVKQLLLERELPKDFVPVLQWRAFGTKTRLSDMAGSGATAERELQDAIALVKQETAGRVHDERTYIEWFATTLGRNVARMHEAGYTHGYVTSHNVTLDCRITDFDSVVPLKRTQEDVLTAAETDDIQKAEVSLTVFMATVAAKTPISSSDILAWFHDAYQAERQRAQASVA